MSLKKGLKQYLVTDRYKLNKRLDQIDVANRLSALEALKISNVDASWSELGIG